MRSTTVRRSNYPLPRSGLVQRPLCDLGHATPPPWLSTLEKHGFDPRWAYMGHDVGLSVHDVGDWIAPFEEGMVLAIGRSWTCPSRSRIPASRTPCSSPRQAPRCSTAAPKEVDALLGTMR
jgi:hypothetical protein